MLTFWVLLTCFSNDGTECLKFKNQEHKYKISTDSYTTFILKKCWLTHVNMGCWMRGKEIAISFIQSPHDGATAVNICTLWARLLNGRWFKRGSGLNIEMSSTTQCGVVLACGRSNSQVCDNSLFWPPVVYGTDLTNFKRSRSGGKRAQKHKDLHPRWLTQYKQATTVCI